jgi:hypothetical protein
MRKARGPTQQIPIADQPRSNADQARLKTLIELCDRLAGVERDICVERARESRTVSGAADRRCAWQQRHDNSRTIR